VLSKCNVVRYFFLHIPSLDTTCFGLTGHLQVYMLLRILLFTVKWFCFLPIVVASGYFDYVSYMWLLLVLFDMLFVAALNVLARAGVL
jgi:hypothetical protein